MKEQSKRFVVKYEDIEIGWENGSYFCDRPDVLKWIREKCEAVSRIGQGVELDGSVVCSCFGRSPEFAYITAFAALHTFFGGRIELVEGHRPTWEKNLGWKPGGKVIT